jgi:hypothetical protein
MLVQTGPSFSVISLQYAYGNTLEAPHLSQKAFLLRIHDYPAKGHPPNKPHGRPPFMPHAVHYLALLHAQKINIPKEALRRPALGYDFEGPPTEGGWDQIVTSRGDGVRHMPAKVWGFQMMDTYWSGPLKN